MRIETAKERSNAFKKELKQLLSKYNAEIELEDIGINWHQNWSIIAHINSITDDEGYIIKEYSEINLGDRIDEHSLNL